MKVSMEIKKKRKKKQETIIVQYLISSYLPFGSEPYIDILVHNSSI